MAAFQCREFHAMLTTHPSSVFQKRDLHVGGLGSTLRANTPSLAQVSEDLIDRPDSWLDRARNAEAFIRSNPWTAVALVGLAGLAAGIAISRRGRAFP
jgi:ElaB/YqjD/DUF883 family membrane-anchored ribosome-binding protein